MPPPSAEITKRLWTRWCLVLVLLTGSTRGEASPASNASTAEFAPEVTRLISPAGPGAMGSSLVTGDDGVVYLSWVEPAAADQQALKFASFDAAAGRWSPPRLIYQAADMFVNWADFPALAVEKSGRVTAVWYVNSPAPAMVMPPAEAAGEHHHHEAACHAMVSQSTDGGKSWSKPQALSSESDSVEFVSLISLRDNRVLAAWLDGRAKKSGGKAEQLYSRIIGSSGADTLVDGSVCDCCQTSLTTFRDGSALLAYRGRTNEEVRDIRAARFAEGRWLEPAFNSRDQWKINGCPVNGPQLTSSGARAVVAWYTAAGDEPRVLTASSPDAGGIFTMASRVDLGRPVGRVDALLLRDGTRLISWLEDAGTDESQRAGIYLRRFAPSGSTLRPALLAPATAAKTSGVPRMALLRDVRDNTPAQLLVSYTRADEPSRLETLLVTLPDSAALAAADDACGCAGSDELAAGIPVRGKIVGTSDALGTVRLAHGVVPGWLRETETEFKAAPNVLAVVKSGNAVTARVEERSDGLWIFDVRLQLSSQP